MTAKISAVSGDSVGTPQRGILIICPTISLQESLLYYRFSTSISSQKSLQPWATREYKRFASGLQWKHSQWQIPYRAAARFASAFSFFNRFVFEKSLEDCPASKENPKNNIFSLCNLATHLTTISNDFPMIPTHVKLNFVTEKNWNKSVWWSSWKTYWKISDV